jgi:hypothetical protein
MMMTPLKSKSRKDRAVLRSRTTERRSSAERRSGKDRRRSKAKRQRAGRSVRDLYKTDLDRHLWSWPVTSAKKKRAKDRERRKRRRKFVGLVASAAGALGAAGLSYMLYRRLHEDETRERDPDHAEADLDEADFQD